MSSSYNFKIPQAQRWLCGEVTALSGQGTTAAHNECPFAGHKEHLSHAQVPQLPPVKEMINYLFVKDIIRYDVLTTAFHFFL